MRLPRVLLLLLHAGDWIGECYVSSGGNILELSTGIREIAQCQGKSFSLLKASTDHNLDTCLHRS